MILTVYCAKTPFGFLQGWSFDWNLQKGQQVNPISLQGQREDAHLIQLQFITIHSGNGRE